MDKFAMVTKTLLEQCSLPLHSDDSILVLRKIVSDLFEAMEAGDSCIQLHSDEEIKVLCASGLAQVICSARLPNVPLCIYQVEGLNFLYLTRYYYYENRISLIISQLCNASTSIDKSKINSTLELLKTKSQQFDFPNQGQYLSIKKSLQQKFSIITGGPGTGKTTSVVLILWGLFQIYGKDLKILLGAPTGKAAQRVKESLQDNLDNIEDNLNLDISDIRNFLNNNESCGTIHKLLGYIHQSIYFRYNNENNLDADVLIIDESSMISLPLFYKLISAINISKIKHLIFLGDPNQLYSVEEGFVFNSLVNASSAPYYVSALTISKRNQGDVSRLAKAILDNNSALVMDILNNSKFVSIQRPNQQFIMHSILYGTNNIFEFIEYCQNKTEINNANEIKDLFKHYTRCAVLCMTNLGKLGVVNLNSEIEHLIKTKIVCNEPWYSGRSIMILSNEKSLNLFNGDIGICLILNGKPRVYFDNGRSFVPEILPKHQLSFAMTIHKSQGSEYEMVKIIIPTAITSNLLSKELIYTAVTRAKKSVEIFSDINNITSLKATIRQSTLNLNIM